MPTTGSDRRKPARWPLIAAVIGFVGLLAGAGAVLLTRGANAGAIEVFAEPSASPGPDPFTPNTATPITTVTTAQPQATLTTSADGALTAKSGDLAGLYGGSLDLAVCDKPKLVSYLNANAPKAKAWATAQGITPAQIPDFVASLTPVVLRDDIRVTNNGFDEATGSPTPRQSILERGTAVLVDNLGQPRVRCYCGNPLSAPTPVRQKLVGQPWPGLDTSRVIRIVPATQPMSEFIVIDLRTGATVTVPAATTTANPPTSTNTSAPVTALPSTTPPTTNPPPVTTASTAPAATAPTPSVELTTIGTVTASSTFGGGTYPPQLAVDGDPTTSWFSAGPQGGFSSYTLQLPSPRTITRIALESNAANRNQSFRQNFGFGLVTIDVLNGGVVTFSQQISLDGTPDPDVDLTLNATGDQLLLTFTGSEDPNCGGFAELSVLGR